MPWHSVWHDGNISSFCWRAGLLAFGGTDDRVNWDREQPRSPAANPRIAAALRPILGREPWQYLLYAEDPNETGLAWCKRIMPAVFDDPQIDVCRLKTPPPDSPSAATFVLQLQRFDSDRARVSEAWAITLFLDEKGELIPDGRKPNDSYRRARQSSDPNLNWLPHHHDVHLLPWPDNAARAAVRGGG